MVVESLRHMNGSRVHIGGAEYTVRVFTVADHMVGYKLNGRDGPGSRNADRCPCPYCAAPAPEVLDYSAAPRARSLGEAAMLPCIPANQVGIDCEHGGLNVVFGLELEYVRNVMVVECGWTATAADDWIEKLAGVTVLGEEEDTEGLSKSITNLAKFMKERKYNVVLRTLRATLKSQVMVSGEWHDKADVIGSMFTHTATMYNVDHTPKPSPEQMQGVVSAAARLRATFVALGVKETTWGACLDPSCATVPCGVGHVVPLSVSRV